MYTDLHFMVISISACVTCHVTYYEWVKRTSSKTICLYTTGKRITVEERYGKGNWRSNNNSIHFSTRYNTSTHIWLSMYIYIYIYRTFLIYIKLINPMIQCQLPSTVIVIVSILCVKYVFLFYWLHPTHFQVIT